MGDFRKLRAWQEAVALAVRSRDAITKLPSAERFALADQWRRAAYSVALDIARGSLHEIEAILALAEALGYLTEPDLAPVRLTRDNCGKMVYGLLRKMGGR